MITNRELFHAATRMVADDVWILASVSLSAALVLVAIFQAVRIRRLKLRLQRLDPLEAERLDAPVQP